MTTIREAHPDDASDLAAIYAPFVTETAVSFEQTPPDAAEMVSRVAAVQDVGLPWLVADVGDRVVGYAYASPFRARWAYRHTVESSVYIAADHRRLGLGRALMVALLQVLRARDVHAVVAGATLPNPGSARLHEALGFEVVGVFPEVGRKFGAWHDVGFWQLTWRHPAP